MNELINYLQSQMELDWVSLKVIPDSQWGNFISMAEQMNDKIKIVFDDTRGDKWFKVVNRFA